MTSIQISNAVITEIDIKYGDTPYVGLNNVQLKSTVYDTRRKEFADWEGIITSFPLSCCSELRERLFLLFNINVNLENKLQKIIGWGHSDSIHLLKYGKCYKFIDCTFACVPKGFEQLMIITVYNASTNMYVPVFHILLQSKLENAYFHALQQCIAASGMYCNPMYKYCNSITNYCNPIPVYCNPIFGTRLEVRCCHSHM
jgi:hypothetical protein